MKKVDLSHSNEIGVDKEYYGFFRVPPINVNLGDMIWVEFYKPVMYGVNINYNKEYFKQ